ncbi:MAG: nicotinamide riboside transporter PnuC [Tannerella sp.]|jgi:nicotinamide mononucleotide transporter|nr:nicotinamide riboside transporter PnuC [Tannerella sp.]
MNPFDFFHVSMTAFELVGVFLGLLYLRLEYKASIRLWPTGIVMSLFYIYIFLASKLYAVTGINVYYLLASIYGWIRWRRSGNSGAAATVRRVPRGYAVRLLAAFAGCFALLAWLLVRYTDSPVPFGDAFTTSLSIVAMWMLAQKYAEQWLLWLVVNGVSAGLYFGQALYPTAVLYAIYAVVAVFGYRKWVRDSKIQRFKDS